MNSNTTITDRKSRIAVSWSGGKDSALALWYLMQNNDFEINHLFTVFDKKLKRVGLHGIPEHLIESQAESIGIPLRKLYLDSSEDHNAYEEMMMEYLKKIKSEGISHVMYGDIFLEDLKKYRDDFLAAAGLKGYYPLWKKGTWNLAEQFIVAGFKTIVCAANEEVSNANLLGSQFDHEFLSNLPSSIDPAGENGEFHTFLYEGPILNKTVSFKMGSVVSKEYSYKIINKQSEEELIKTKFYFKDLHQIVDSSFCAADDGLI